MKPPSLLLILTTAILLTTPTCGPSTPDTLLATPTRRPATPTAKPRTMYACGLDRCRDSGEYGDLIANNIPIWNNPDPDRGGTKTTVTHQQQLTIIQTRRVAAGPGGLWYQLDNGGWLSDLWTTKTKCTSANLSQHSFTDCLMGQY